MHARGVPDPGSQNEEVIDLQAMLADLELLVNTESPSLDVPLLTASASTLASVVARRLGSAPAIIDGPAGPHVHWSGGGTPKVLIVGHHDTVFPVGSCAARPFAVVDGRAMGPGVFDMKAGIVQALHAVASLADRSGVELLITSDEEVGSLTSRDLIEARAIACGSVLVCEPSADGGALKIARKGTGTFEVVVHGKASHAGLEPEKGVNALVAAAELITHIATFGDLSTATTVTPTVAVAGTVDNVVPAEARVKVDVRVEQPGEKERLEGLFASLVTSVPGATIEVLGGINRPPMPATASATLFPVAVAAAAAAGLGEVRGVGVGGGSDGNFTAARGVPTLDGLGAVGGGAHADHEFVL
ncbi:MAG TPA: M20/M25/M40 family metallo-hydrolase, partial [Ilumatobacteraceae bacterium]|nr:M20/M25/M40 family metallo-hydrolase [Ilumatobacteraceae bacterium]